MQRLTTFGFSGVLLGALLLLLTGAPAHADQRTVTFKWRWGGNTNGVRCSLEGSVAAYSSNGTVRVRGSFDGCGGRGGSGDRVLTVIGWGPSGKQYGGGTSVCWTACAKNVRVPYTGKGTYYGLIYVTDGAYLRKHGHDPLAKPFGSVSR